MLDDFFNLLRCSLWGDEPRRFMPLSQQEWKQLLAIAQKQTVLPLVADAISRLPQELAPPASTMDWLLKCSARTVMSHSLLDSSVAKVTELYRSHGIEGILLKGQGIARCYRNPQLRQCGDIDLYVGKDNYAKSVQLAKECLDSEGQEVIESKKHYHFRMEGVVVELHRIAAQMSTPLRRQKFQKWIVSELEDRSRLRTIVINGTDVNVPSADFDVLFIFYHAWYHLVHGGIGLRQICDWAMVLDNHIHTIDRDGLEKRLRSWKLVRPWQILGAIAVEKIGLPASKMPLYDPKMSSRYPWVAKKVMEGGNFGFYGSGVRWAELGKMPLLRRKMVLLKRLIGTYPKIFTIIPMESTCIVAETLGFASVNTVKQMIHRQ